MQLEQLKMQLDQLEQLAGGASPGVLNQPFHSQAMPGPNAGLYSGQGYAHPQGFGANGGGSPLDQWLSSHPYDRQLLEMAIGGQITSTGNGQLMVTPFDAGQFNGGGMNNGTAATAQQLVSNLQRASDYLAGVQAAEQGRGNPYNGAVLGGLANVLNGAGGGGYGGGGGGFGGGGLGGADDGLGMTHQQFEQMLQSDITDAADTRARKYRSGRNFGAPGGGGGFAPGGIGGGGFAPGGFGGGGIDPLGAGNTGNYGPNFQGASFSPSGSGGDPGGYQVAGNEGPIANGDDDVSNILNDGAITIEDKITLMIMAIMKKMDKQIEQMGAYINNLQQQQNKAQAIGGQGGPGAGGYTGPSIDVETMKLKRLIDKRSQMFDMLRQIIDKYNETAKGIIDKIGQT